MTFCLEVAEHVPPALGDRRVEYLSTFPTVLGTSTASPSRTGRSGSPRKDINAGPRSRTDFSQLPARLRPRGGYENLLI